MTTSTAATLVPPPVDTFTADLQALVARARTDRDDALATAHRHLCEAAAVLAAHHPGLLADTLILAARVEAERCPTS